MARVEVAHAALEDLDALVRTQSLPADTRARVARSLRALRRFPLIGPALGGRWEGFRFLLGPWRWMVIDGPDDQPPLTVSGSAARDPPAS